MVTEQRLIREYTFSASSESDRRTEPHPSTRLRQEKTMSIDNNAGSNKSQSNEQQILNLFEAGDKALMAADVESLSHIFADDYIQYDDSGKPHTKQAILEALRSGALRYPSIVSTQRTVRLFGDTAVVHGSESDEVERAGQRSSARYLYLDVLTKRDGEWKIVASQLARPFE